MDIEKLDSLAIRILPACLAKESPKCMDDQSEIECAIENAYYIAREVLKFSAFLRKENLAQRDPWEGYQKNTYTRP